MYLLQIILGIVKLMSSLLTFFKMLNFENVLIPRKRTFLLAYKDFDNFLRSKKI